MMYYIHRIACYAAIAFCFALVVYAYANDNRPDRPFCHVYNYNC